MVHEKHAIPEAGCQWPPEAPGTLVSGDAWGGRLGEREHPAVLIRPSLPFSVDCGSQWTEE